MKWTPSVLTFLLAFLLPFSLYPAAATPAPKKFTNIVETKEPTKPAPINLETEAFSEGGRPTLITQAVALSLLALLPFIVMILTSFLKIVIVLSLLRTALGVQQAPPNQIINGVALMLSLFVMYPTSVLMYEKAQASMIKMEAPKEMMSKESANYFLQIAKDTQQPLKDFLERNSLLKHRKLFFRIAYRILPDNQKESISLDDFIIVIPAYITSQLKDAFEIGVLIYIPFFVIDLVTSNILLAMGMMMLSPVTISMPLKLFLLVMLDGWTILIEGLVTTFR